MADSKLSALSAAGAYSDADLLYIVQGGVSYKTTYGALKAAILLAKYPEVANFAALPAAASHTGETYVCLAAQGTYFINRKPSGFYYSDGASWTYVGELPEDYFTDSILQISDDADPTKICKFQLSSITTGTTRTLTVPDASGTIMLVGDAPTAHKTSHQSGGSDAIKLDDLAAPDDNTDLNASTTAHGLAPKAVAPASGLQSVLGIGNGETAYANKALFDTTNPAALGSVGPGTSLIAARRDHIHALPALDALAAATDITTANATTSAHGLLVKATAPSSGLRNVVAIDNGETAYTNKALFDATNPAALGSASPGSAMTAARRDHVHAIPVVGTWAVIQLACSDLSTAITAGTSKAVFRMPYAMTLTEVRASVNTAPTGATLTIDINEGGTTVLSTKLTIDASEKTSTTAATPPVISDSALADDAEITIDFDQVGSTIAGAGVVVTLIGTRA